MASAHENKGFIKAISKNDVHRICSGQVVLSLSTAVKELVENSLDAGATVIDIRFKHYGSELVEVSDNGVGVHPDNFQALTLKHHTSKLQDFSDLLSVETFGFRGEALSSLCALSEVSIITRHSTSQCGTHLCFNSDGIITSSKPVARQIGTTVSLKNLFSTIPVRQKEFHRNLKREFAKMTQLLYAYCLVSTNIKITCTNQSKNERKTTIVSTQSSKTVRENISCVFGAKQLKNLKEWSHVPSDEDQCLFHLDGIISSCAHGSGRSSNDRQFFYINSRPCEPTKIIRAVNEVYSQFNQHQSPFVFLNIKVARKEVDINVTPDKRLIFLNQEKHLLELIKKSLQKLFELTPSTFAMNNISDIFVKKNINNDNLTVTDENLDKSNKKLENADNVTTNSSDNLVSTKQNDNNSISKNYNEKIINNSTSLNSYYQLKDLSDSKINDSVEVKEEENSESPTSEISIQKESVDMEINITSNKIMSSPNNDNRLIEPNLDILNCFDSWKSKDNKRPGDDINAVSRKKNKQIKLGNDLRLEKEEDKFKGVGIQQFKEKLKELFSSKKNSENTKDNEESNDMSSDTALENGYSNENSNQINFDENSYVILNKNDNLGSENTSEFLEDDKNYDSGYSSNKASQSMDDNGRESPIIIDDSNDLELTRSKKIIDISIDEIEALQIKMMEEKDMKNIASVRFRAQINPANNSQAELELSREIKKEMFPLMQVIGQFNLGFIIARLKSDLFIIDQHATDEKYNFETLQKTTVISNQRLVVPQKLDLTAINESILIENIEIFKTNGFEFQINEEALPMNRIFLTAIPMSKNWTFGKEDVDELIFMLQDSPHTLCRPSRVRAMFASRACRKSIMIGTALTTSQMKTLINHMSEIEHPWNCPHGRPTMRHLVNLDLYN